MQSKRQLQLAAIERAKQIRVFRLTVLASGQTHEFQNEESAHDWAHSRFGTSSYRVEVAQ
jgi:hypothetical protein